MIKCIIDKDDLSRSRPLIVNIRRSEFKVGGTYIYSVYNTAHYYNEYTHYKMFYSNTIFYRLTWGFNNYN